MNKYFKIIFQISIWAACASTYAYHEHNGDRAGIIGGWRNVGDANITLTITEGDNTEDNAGGSGVFTPMHRQQPLVVRLTQQNGDHDYKKEIYPGVGVYPPAQIWMSVSSGGNTEWTSYYAASISVPYVGQMYAVKQRGLLFLNLGLDTPNCQISHQCAVWKNDTTINDDAVR